MLNSFAGNVFSVVFFLVLSLFLDINIRSSFIVFILIFTIVTLLRFRNVDLFTFHSLLLGAYIAYDVVFGELFLFLLALSAFVLGSYLNFGLHVISKNPRNLGDLAVFWLVASASAIFQWRFAGPSPPLLLNMMLAAQSHIKDATPIRYVHPWAAALLHMYTAMSLGITDSVALIVVALPYLTTALYQYLKPAFGQAVCSPWA